MAKDDLTLAMTEDGKPVLTDLAVQSGREFFDALAAMGFIPDVACWVFEHGQDFIEDYKLHYAIVDSSLERVAPRAVYELLFRAYDASITPSVIDPFRVTLFGTLSLVGRNIIRTLEGLKQVPERNDADLDVGFTFIESDWGDGALSVFTNGIYRGEPKSRSATQDSNRIRRMRAAIDRMAA